MRLQGVELEVDDLEAHREMTTCFIEEYLRMGFDAERIMKMFTTPAYVGPSLAREALGEDAVREVLEDQLRLRGRKWTASGLVRHRDGSIGLPVIEEPGV
jgi:hypothetical protein